MVGPQVRVHEIIMFWNDLYRTHKLFKEMNVSTNLFARVVVI